MGLWGSGSGPRLDEEDLAACEGQIHTPRCRHAHTLARAHALQPYCRHSRRAHLQGQHLTQGPVSQGPGQGAPCGGPPCPAPDQGVSFPVRRS